MGQNFNVDVQQLDAANHHELIGGITARVEPVPEPNELRRMQVDLTLPEIELINQLAVESHSDFSAAIGRLASLQGDDPLVNEVIRRLRLDTR